MTPVDDGADRADGANRGHRVLPHTADIRLEAWGPSREVCLAEAVSALVGSFADTAGARATGAVEAELTADTDEDALLAVLDEVIYRLDTEDVVPLDIEVHRRETGLTVRIPVTDMSDVEMTGAVPKAVSLNELRFSPDGRGWSCTATIDI